MSVAWQHCRVTILFKPGSKPRQATPKRVLHALLMLQPKCGSKTDMPLYVKTQSRNPALSIHNMSGKRSHASRHFIGSPVNCQRTQHLFQLEISQCLSATILWPRCTPLDVWPSRHPPPCLGKDLDASAPIARHPHYLARQKTKSTSAHVYKSCYHLPRLSSHRL